MNWDRVEGNWKQFTGKVKEKWGELTDDDLTTINGRRDQLEGKIQERYGYGKDQVKKEVDDWLGGAYFEHNALLRSGRQVPSCRPDSFKLARFTLSCDA